MSEETRHQRDERDQLQSVAQAQRDLADISELRRSTGFQRWFLRRLGDTIEKQRRIVLEGNQSAEELHRDRAILKKLEEIPKLIDQDEATARRLLESISDI